MQTALEYLECVARNVLRAADRKMACIERNEERRERNEARMRGDRDDRLEELEDCGPGPAFEADHRQVFVGRQRKGRETFPAVVISSSSVSHVSALGGIIPAFTCTLQIDARDDMKGPTEDIERMILARVRHDDRLRNVLSSVDDYDEGLNIHRRITSVEILAAGPECEFLALGVSLDGNPLVIHNRPLVIA